jgi:hypothetical protein
MDLIAAPVANVAIIAITAITIISSTNVNPFLIRILSYCDRPSTFADTATVDIVVAMKSLKLQTIRQ